MSEPRQILIIRLSSLGDILHTLPAYQSLRKSCPAAQIGWLIEKRMQYLLSAVPGIDRIHVLDTVALRRKPANPQAWREMARPIREMRSVRYDLCLDFQGLLKTAFFSLLSGARERLGFSKDLVREWPAHWFYSRRIAKPEKKLHVTELNCLLVQAAGIQAKKEPAKVQAAFADEQAIHSRLMAGEIQKFVIINPGGGWPTKRWPAAKYGRLAARIQKELGLTAVVTTGPGEERLFEEIARHCPGAPPRHFPVPFLQLIPLLNKSLLLIGGDTGPLHLACALQKPVVGIFGPTDPLRNGPWSDMDESVVHMLPCSFCNGRKCPTQIECMEISVEEVFVACMRLLDRIR